MDPAPFSSSKSKVAIWSLVAIHVQQGFPNAKRPLRNHHKQARQSGARRVSYNTGAGHGPCSSPVWVGIRLFIRTADTSS